MKPKSSQTPQHDHLARPCTIRPLFLGATALLAALAGCSDKGADARTSGGSGGGVGDPLAVDFGLRRDWRIGNGLIGDATSADLDGDGLDDLIEGDFGSMELAIALGNPDGTFSPIGIFPTAGHSWRVVTADLDGDGRLDIAVATGDYLGAGQSTIDAFLQGPGVAEFGTRRATLVLADDPKDIAVQPSSGLAGDPGPDDLFVPVRDERAVLQIRLGAGDQLEEIARLDSSALGAVGGPYSADAVDLGADGLLDLVVGELQVDGGLPDRVIVYPRTSSGFGAPSIVLDGAEWPLVQMIGDVDGNGFEDVSVAQIQSEDVYLLAGGPGGLDTIHSLTFAGITSSLIFADANDDGLADAIGSLAESSALELHLATGPFQWGDATFYQAGFLPRAVAMIELPGDDIPDLLCANADDISVLTGLGQGMFRSAVGYPTLTGGPVAVRTSDLDEDGDLDAITIAVFQQAVSFMEGQPDGSFVTVTTVPLIPTTNETPGYLAIGDVDLDGLNDVLITVKEPNQVRVLRNNGTVDGFDEAEPGDIYTVGNSPAGIALGDVNGDDLPDAIVGNLLDETLQVLLNTGNGEFQVQPPIAIGARPAVVELFDLDGDEVLDAIVTTGEPELPDASGTLDEGSLLVLQGDGLGGFAVVDTQPVDSTATSLDFGDLDQDGLVDLVIAPTGYEFDALNVFWNRGNLQFEREDVIVGTGPANVIVDDVNRDGNLDLFVPSGFGELNVVFGDGAGGFPEVFPGVNGALPVLRDTIGVDYAEVSGDDLPDLLFVSTSSPFLWVGVNTSVELPSN